MGSLSPKLPYWHINVPEDQRTEECPEFLRSLSVKDMGIISTSDSEYRLSTWAEVQKLILDNRIDLFRRVPSELRKYLEYTWKLRRDHGSVMDFMLTQRLRWDTPITPKGRPFECEEDIKILWNDWPYGVDKKIIHIVVWTKFKLEDDPATDDLTETARAEIDAFVRKTFGSRVSSDRYIWFKNWRSLKSVQAVEHFHIMLYDPDPAFVDEITKGDVPLIRKV